MQLTAQNMQINVNRLIADPEFYLYNYVEKNDTSEFLIVKEELLDIAPFIDKRIEPYARGQFAVGSGQLSELVGNQPGPLPQQNFIFHHAFVCSTLLARCLARADAFFSLKEPQIMRRLSDIKTRRSQVSGRQRRLPRSWSRIVDTHVKLLAKRYTGGQSIVIKASNVSNNLLLDVAEQLPTSRFVYMHGSLEGFLVSILKKPLDAQRRIGPLLQRFMTYADFARRFPEYAKCGELDLLQQGALLWLVSNDHFLRVARAKNGGRFVTLDAERFLQKPQQVLSRVARHFGQEFSQQTLQRVTDDGVMKVHAKDPRQAYCADRRGVENREVLQRYHTEIDLACRWLQPVSRQLEIEQKLARISL